jgi:hypothetical protein
MIRAGEIYRLMGTKKFFDSGFRLNSRLDKQKLIEYNIPYTQLKE